MKISREFKVGLVSIVAVVLLYWGLNFLKGQDVFEKKKVFYAVYDRVEGLTPAKSIILNGYKIGTVDKVYFHPNGSGNLVVAMNITSDFDIPKNSVAVIQSTDLLGDKAINMMLGKSQEYAQNGDTLKSQIELSLTEEVNKQVAPLKNKVEKLFGSMDTVLFLLTGFLDDDSKDGFEATLSSLKRSFLHLENTLSSLDKTVTTSQSDMVGTFANLNKITTNLEENSEELSGIFTNLNSLSDSLSRVKFKETFESLNNTLVAAESVLAKVDSGDGSMAKLVNDPELYNNLERASEQLDLLLLDIKHNPKRYINISPFGGRKDYDEEELLKKEAKDAANREELKDQLNK